jgi:hypothetical protein
MNKYIGFDIDSKKIVVCVVENGKKELLFIEIYLVHSQFIYMSGYHENQWN